MIRSGGPAWVRRVQLSLAALAASVASDAQLVINEIDYDQEGTDSAEFVELYNAGVDEIDLDAYVLELVNGSHGAPYQIFDLPDRRLAPGGYFVICTDPVEIELCDFVVGPPFNWLQNGAPDAVALWSRGDLFDTVSYEGETAAPYTEGPEGAPADDPFAGRVAIARLPDGWDTQQNHLDWLPICSTPGRPNADARPPCDAPEPLEIALGGACPGDGTVTITGGSGGGTAILLAGSGPGADPLPGGPCGGPSGLESPRVVLATPFDVNGNLVVERRFAPAQCARPLQAVDPTTCRLSDLAAW